MSASSPPTSTPPTIHKKGGGGLIMVGVAILLLGGGAVYWKISQKPPEPEITEVRIKEEPKEEAPVLDHAAPPPPSEESLQEPQKPETTSKVGDGTKPSGPPGCGGECKGSAGADLQSALRTKGGQARGCYNRALRLNSGLEGKLTVSLRVSPTGQVCSASAASDTLGDASVTSCVLQMFRSGKYPAPSGGCVQTAVPLNFVSKQ